MTDPLDPIDAILAGDVGMNAIYLAFIFALAVAITIVAFVFIYWSTKHPEEKDSHALAKYEKQWVVLIFIIFIAFSLSTVLYTPYPYAHASVHHVTVDVTGQQFAWTLCQAPYWANSSTSLNNPSCYPNKNAAIMTIPVGETVLFNVTSFDVTHDFGVYLCTDGPACSTASILAQVQVMPGFYNQIMVSFTKPGIYYIRCLEFCGFGHYTMISSLNVTSSA